jgi:hypothetical protein
MNSDVIADIPTDESEENSRANNPNSRIKDINDKNFIKFASNNK